MEKWRVFRFTLIVICWGVWAPAKLRPREMRQEACWCHLCLISMAFKCFGLFQRKYSWGILERASEALRWQTPPVMGLSICFLLICTHEICMPAAQRKTKLFHIFAFFCALFFIKSCQVYCLMHKYGEEEKQQLTSCLWQHHRCIESDHTEKQWIIHKWHIHSRRPCV